MAISRPLGAASGAGGRIMNALSATGSAAAKHVYCMTQGRTTEVVVVEGGEGERTGRAWCGPQSQ